MQAKLRLGVAVLLVAACSALPLHGMTIEVGVTGGGGLALAYGALLDNKAASLAILGAASLTALGSSQAQLFPGWSAGVYAQTDLLSWLSLRLEILYESAGALRTAFTSGGSPFDQYGISFASVNVAVLAVARFALGPGRIWGALGPFFGLVAGSVTVVDRYASSTTTAVITPSFSHIWLLGLSGGIGYSLRAGPGIAGIELRSDWSILPVWAAGDGINPIGVDLVLSYGFPLKTGAK
jgi:hypothetical protein